MFNVSAGSLLAKTETLPVKPGDCSGSWHSVPPDATVFGATAYLVPGLRLELPPGPPDSSVIRIVRGPMAIRIRPPRGRSITLGLGLLRAFPRVLRFDFGFFDFGIAHLS